MATQYAQFWGVFREALVDLIEDLPQRNIILELWEFSCDHFGDCRQPQQTQCGSTAAQQHLGLEYIW